MKKSSLSGLALALCLLATSAATEAAPAKKPSDSLQKNSIAQSNLSPQSIECSIMLTGKKPMSVRDGQRRLTTLGYYKEPLSDEENFEMTRAIRNFQRDSRLEITGELDEPTRTLLIQKTDPRYQ